MGGGGQMAYRFAAEATPIVGARAVRTVGVVGGTAGGTPYANSSGVPAQGLPWRRPGLRRAAR
jgi:hypothetical protein